MNKLFLLLIPLFGACATHTPMSEMVMFTPKKVKVVSANNPDSISTYYSKYSFAASLEQKGMSYTQLKKYSTRNGNDSEIDDSGKAPTISLNSIFMNPRNDFFALNVAMFPSIGIDATFRVSKKNYITIGHTAWGGQQVILQRRMHYNQKSGSSLGFFYEHMYQATTEECYSTLCFPSSPDSDQVFYLNGFGIRGFALISEEIKNRSFLKINGKIGFIPEFKGSSFTQSIYGGLGLSIGLY